MTMGQMRVLGGCFCSLVVCWSMGVVVIAVAIPRSSGGDRGTTTPNPDAPLEFPQFNQNYTFVDNSSIRANFVSRSNDSEVDDLLERKEAAETVEPGEPAEIVQDLARESETEWIENGDDTEDLKFAVTDEQSTTTTSTSEASEQETTPIEETSTPTEGTISLKESNLPYKDGVALIDGNAAAILAVAFLVMSICAYVALLLWRHSLERKYGSREMLVDKDDMYDPDDMRHFSI